MDTELPLEAIRKYNVAHSPICSKMKSALLAVKRQLISEQKRAATVLRKTAKLAEQAAAKVPAKKGKKATSAKVKEDTLAVPAESLMVEHAEGDGEESLDEFLDNEVANIRESGSQAVNNAIAAEPVERITTLTRKNIETQDETDDGNDEEYYHLDSDEEHVSFSSDDDDDTALKIIDTRELTRVFLEKKKLEKKRKASSDDDDFEVLRHFKKRQVATYPIITL
jgi:hypothetical protein